MKRNSYAPLKAFTILCGFIISYVVMGFPLPLPVTEEPDVILVAFTPEGESRVFQSPRFQTGNEIKITLTEYVIINREKLDISVIRYVQLTYSFESKKATTEASQTTSPRRNTKRHRA